MYSADLGLLASKVWCKMCNVKVIVHSDKTTKNYHPSLQESDLFSGVVGGQNRDKRSVNIKIHQVDTNTMLVCK